MKAALMWLLLLALAVACAGRSLQNDRAVPDVSVISIDWKYAGYTRVETIKENERKQAPDASTRYRIARGSVYVFKYAVKATLKNTGSKTIKAVSWDYVFVDAKDQRELKRYKLQTKQQILPGEAQTLARGIGLDPKESTQHINAGKQQVEITRIEYADGSVWRR